MSAPTSYRIAANNRREAETRSRIVDRLRAQFPELDEAQLQAAVGGTQVREFGPSAVEAQLEPTAPRTVAPRQYRA